MKVINVHKRAIQQPAAVIGALLDTLATKEDRMLATDKWPRMRLDKGLAIGSKGGHGPIRYTVVDYTPEKSVTFQFDMQGFDGFHRFDIRAMGNNESELLHTIDMHTSGIATLKWVIGIRWLHDALIEDAFDKVENQFIAQPKTTPWNLWVKFMRAVMRSKRR